MRTFLSRSPVLVRFNPVLAIGAALFLLCFAATPTAFAQPSQEDRVADLIRQFDQRVDEVEALVEASRNPAANTLLTQAKKFRDQAESELRAGRFETALNLATRALEQLKQAENAARTGGGNESVDRVERLLQVQRQRLQDARRTLDDFETGSTNAPVSPNASLFSRQRDRTLQLIEEAEQCCGGDGSGNDPTSALGANRCADLTRRARELYEQATSLGADAAEVAPIDLRAAENGVRDARLVLDRAQADLDQIDREIGSGNPALANSMTQRLRAVNERIRFAYDRLRTSGVSGTKGPATQAHTALGILRKAAELARSALGICQGGTENLSAEYDRRLQVVLDLRSKVDDLTDGVVAVPEADQADGLIDQANGFADSGNLETALPTLGQAATLLNRALGAIGANRPNTSRLATLNQLQQQFDRLADELGHTGDGPIAVDGPCADGLRQAGRLRRQSETEEEAGNIDLAFATINQAQRVLSQAASCLGVTASRIRNLLDRYQSEFDRRKLLIETALDGGPHPVATTLLNEAVGLRQGSDDHESEGRFELALQTVGRAISVLGQAQSLLTDPNSDRNADLLAKLQGQFDDRAARVQEIVAQSPAANGGSLLNEASQLRARSETSANGGNLQAALMEIGRAIQLLEQATSAAIGSVNASSVEPIGTLGP